MSRKLLILVLLLSVAKNTTAESLHSCAVEAPSECLQQKRVLRSLAEARDFLGNVGLGLYRHQQLLLSQIASNIDSSSALNVTALHALGASLPLLEAYPDVDLKHSCVDIALQNLRCLNQRYGAEWPASFQRSAVVFHRGLRMFRAAIDTARPFFSLAQRRRYVGLEEKFARIVWDLELNLDEAAQSKLREEREGLLVFLGELNTVPLLRLHVATAKRLLESLLWENP